MTTHEFDARCQAVLFLLPHDAAGVPPILRRGVAPARTPEEALALQAPNVPTQQSPRSLTIFESIAVCVTYASAVNRAILNYGDYRLIIAVIFTCSRCLFPAFLWSNGKCEMFCCCCPFSSLSLSLSLLVARAPLSSLLPSRGWGRKGGEVTEIYLVRSASPSPLWALDFVFRTAVSIQAIRLYVAEKVFSTNEAMTKYRDKAMSTNSPT